jgi:hypothetical protein
MISMNLVTIAALVGFVGDAVLQVMVASGLGGPTGWGLKAYFKQHGRAESMFIAAGMMVIFYIMYLGTGLPLKLEYLAVYGIALDLLFREMRIFPSLDGYYKSLNYFWSAVWGAIPMMIPLAMFNQLNKSK